MGNKNNCIAIFKTHQEAEQAIMELKSAGFDIKKLSIIGKSQEREEKVIGYYNGINRVKFWGKRAALWGGLWGVIFNPAFMCIPGASSLTAGGILFTTFANGLSTSLFTGGFPALGTALYSIGIPRNSIINYETAVKMKKHLLIVHGTYDEVEHAGNILNTSKEVDVAVYTTK